MKPKLYILSLLGATTLLLGCADSQEQTKPDQTVPLKVTVATPTVSDESVLTFSGKIEAVEKATLSTRNMGYITHINAEVGDEVKEGQMLIAINNAELQAKRAQVNAGITEAEAAFQNAEKDYERFRALLAENSATQKEMDDITSRYEMARARLEGAKQQKNEITAQFAIPISQLPLAG